MPEEQDVKETPSTPETVVKETPAEETATVEQPQQETTEQETPSQEQGNVPSEELDDRGIPWKNRAHELERKLTELSDRLPDIIQESLAKNQQPQKPQYTIRQLEEFIENTSDPANKAWARDEIRRLDREEVTRSMRDEFGKFTQAQQAEIKRQQSLQYVRQSYPDAFTTDALGNVTWNTTNPLVQQIGMIMKDKRFANDPEGLVAAADIAAGRLWRMQQQKTTKKVSTLQRNLKKAQQAALVEGGGTVSTTQPADSFVKAKKRLAETGHLKDAKLAVTEYLKRTGVINE